MNNKKGLSNLVATVLIVLLALAAVAIIWGFLRPTFDDAATTTGLRSACFLVELEATGCSVASNVATVTYKTISTDDKFSGVVAVVEDSASVTNTTRGSAPGPLQSVNVDVAVPNPPYTAPFEARVAAVVSDGAGNEEVCAESASVVCGP
ncbi:MAG: hypothetical protein ABH864_04880 [archaeon]